MLRKIFCYSVLASFNLVLNGCTDDNKKEDPSSMNVPSNKVLSSSKDCPQSLVDGLSDLKNQAETMQTMPYSNKSESIAMLKSFDKAITMCKKIVEDHKSYSGCLLEGKVWDKDVTNKNCLELESVVAPFKKVVAEHS